MSEMVERVARAMCAPFPEDEEIWLGGYMKRWESHKDSARAAIAAMREPTEGMIDAAYTFDECWSSYEVIYTVMIDAALEETK